MLTLFILYGIIILVLAIGAFFIVYHILKYSITPSLGYFGTLLFVTVLFFLLFINFVSFRSLETNPLLPDLEISPLLEAPSGRLVPTSTNPW